MFYKYEETGWHHLMWIEPLYFLYGLLYIYSFKYQIGCWYNIDEQHFESNVKLSCDVICNHAELSNTGFAHKGIGPHL